MMAKEIVAAFLDALSKNHDAHVTFSSSAAWTAPD